MDTILAKILEKIEFLADLEERDLISIGKEGGIFDMPEVAFAYACGKFIMKNRREVFNHDDVKWEREIGLEKGKRTDLVFRLQGLNRLIAIEFKMRDTIHNYRSDVEKLLALKPNAANDMKITRVFCALIDAFTDKGPNDERIVALDNYHRLRTIKKEKLTFGTKQKWYTSNISCVLCFWEVLD